MNTFKLKNNKNKKIKINSHIKFKKYKVSWVFKGTSLVVQRLRICASTSRIAGTILVRKLRSHRPQLSSVQFSRSVVSDSLWPHELQHARPSCPSPTPGVYSNSRPLSRWCHPAISSSVVLFSSCPQSLPASGSFQWVNSSHEVAKVLEFQLQHQSLQWTPRTDLL